MISAVTEEIPSLRLRSVDDVLTYCTLMAGPGLRKTIDAYRSNPESITFQNLGAVLELLRLRTYALLARAEGQRATIDDTMPEDEDTALFERSVNELHKLELWMPDAPYPEAKLLEYSGTIDHQGLYSQRARGVLDRYAGDPHFMEWATAARLYARGRLEDDEEGPIPLAELGGDDKALYDSDWKLLLKKADEIQQPPKN